MSSDEDERESRLADTEKIIRALEALGSESETRGLAQLAGRIGQCVAKCQADYLNEQRRAYNRISRGANRPPSTKH